jgi:hypothetical protein
MRMFFRRPLHEDIGHPLVDASERSILKSEADRAHIIATRCRYHYNQERLHIALCYRTSLEFALCEPVSVGEDL